METPALPPAFRGEEAARALAHLFRPPPAHDDEAAGEDAEDAEAALDQPLPPLPPPPCVLAYRDLLRPVSPQEGGDTIRVEYTCVDVSSRYLLCGSNTGVVDIYQHDGTGGDCRLLKALVPPKRSQHTNVKVTCVKLDPAQRALAVGNILGAVNVLLLDFSEGGRAQKMLHSHAHHQDAVRCLAWDDVGQRLFSGCDGGVIVETKLPRQGEAGGESGGAGNHAAGPGGGSGGLSGGRQLGPLMALFQTCSSAVWYREESELLQLAFHAVSGPLPKGMQRPGDPPADGLLLASHFRRCNLHLVNRGFAKSLLYSIQVEGGGTASSGRTIFGAALQPIMDAANARLEKLYLYVSRPQGKFWKVDLGSTNPVKTLAPGLVVLETPGEEGTAPMPIVPLALGGRLMLSSFPAPMGDCLASWTYGGGLYLVALDEEQAVSLWADGIHDVAVLRGAPMKLALLHGRDKAVGMLEVSAARVKEAGGEREGRPHEQQAASVLQRAWRKHRAQALQRRMEELLEAIHGAEQRSRAAYANMAQQQQQQLLLLQENKASGRRGMGVQDPEGAGGEMDTQTAALLQEVELVCGDARQFLSTLSTTEEEASAPSNATTGSSLLDPASLALVEMVDKVLLESQRLLAPPPREPDVAAKAPSTANPSVEIKPLVYKQVGRRWKERQGEAATAVAESPRSVVVGVQEIVTGEAGVGTAISALAALEYEVRLVASSGLGLDLAFVGSGVVVRELAFLADGRPSPAQLCGRIRPGDALLAVNGVLLEPLSLKDKLGVLLALAGEDDTEIALRFMAKEASSWSRSLVGLGLGGGGAGGSTTSSETDLWAETPPLQLPPPPPQPTPPPASPLTSETPTATTTEEQQRRAMEKVVELGLVAPKSAGSATGAEHQSMVQQFLTSTLLPWKYRFWDEGGKGGAADLLGGGHGGGGCGRKKWGEFGWSDANLGLVLAPEELGNDLERIAQDVQNVWITEERAHESHFYDEDHHFSALLGRQQAGVDAAATSLLLSDKQKKLLALHRAWGRERHGKRDIAREYLGLLYFKDLLKMSAARGKRTSGSSLEEEVEEDGGNEETDVFGASGAFLSATGGVGTVSAPMQVYLEAVPLSDVLAELGNEGVESGEEELQDLDGAMEVLSRVLQATLAEMVGAARESATGLAAVSKPWPPIQLTHVTGMAVAVQQAHAILASSETMLQEWLRCFQPLSPTQRHMIWESSASFLSQHIHPDDADMIQQHHLLTCELVTLYFQMHTVWSLLEKNVRRPEAGAGSGGGGGGGGGGTEEVRLCVSWGRQEEGCEDTFDTALGVLHVASARGQVRPTQWKEEEALTFLEEYGAYVMLEGVVKACLARGFERALWWVLRDLAPREERFQVAEKALVQALKANMEDGAALVRQVKETEYPLSLAVALLPKVVASSSFSTSTIVAEVHCAFFPDLRPWLIRSVLAAKEKEKDHTSAFAAAALIIINGVDEAWHSCLRAVGIQKAAGQQEEGEEEDRDEKSAPARPPPPGVPILSEEESFLGLDEATTDVPALQEALRRRLTLLRRAISAGDLMTCIQTHIWDTTAASSSGRACLPPVLLGAALVEAAAADTLDGHTNPYPTSSRGSQASGRKRLASMPVPLKEGLEEEDAATPDPIEGRGGVGVAINLQNEYVCGVCQLPCCSSGAGGAGPEGWRGSYLLMDEGDADEEHGRDTPVLLFTCNHLYHSHCLPEQACVLCLRDNFFPF